MPQPDFRIALRGPRMLSEMEITIPGQPTVRYSSEEVPMSVADEFQQVVGDGRARVSVTADVGIKDFGTGASASCTVVLTCGQDARTIERAVQLAGEAARGYAQENRQRAEQELLAILAARPQGPR